MGLLMRYEKRTVQERLERVKAYLEQISPDHHLESAKEQLQASTGGDDSGETLEVMVAGRDDSEALETLDVVIRDGESANVTPANLDSLEAIIHKKGRPAIDIVNDSFNAPAGEWNEIGRGETKKRIERVIPSIGRIEVPNDLRPYAGTGFVEARKSTDSTTCDGFMGRHRVRASKIFFATTGSGR